MERRNVVYFLIGLNVVFFLALIVGVAFLHRHIPLISIGLPYVFIDWLVIGLSLGSMMFVDYQIFLV
ncbi:MAG: hypothetical protein ABIJ21_07300 [Nanoarchaeota archaeon]